MRTTHWVALVVAAVVALPAWSGVTVHDTGSRPVKGSSGMIALRDITLDTGAAKFMLRMGNGAIGMRRPNPANFYQGGFFYVGVGKARFFKAGKFVAPDAFKPPFDVKVAKQAEAVEVVATQTRGAVSVEARFRAEAGADHLLMTLRVQGHKPTDPMAVKFVTYPSYFVRKTAHKAATTSSGRTVEFKFGDKKPTGDPKLKPSEFWLYLRDRSLDATKRAGLGLKWNPAEVRSPNVAMGYYAVYPFFYINPKAPTARFALWDFTGKTPAQALERMKRIPAPAVP